MEAKVRHNRCHDGVLSQLAFFRKVFSDDVHDLITIDDVAIFINSNQTITVSVKRPKPIADWLSLTTSWRASGCVEPTFKFILRPSGVSPITVNLSPKVCKFDGALVDAAPLAVSKATSFPLEEFQLKQGSLLPCVNLLDSPPRFPSLRHLDEEECLL